VADDVLKNTKALIFQNGHMLSSEIRLIREMPLTIYVDGEELVTLLCTGQYPEDLAVGFLRSEGILDTWDEVSSLMVDEGAGAVWVGLKKRRKLRQDLLHRRTLGAGCGRASLYFQPLDGLQIKQVGSGPRVSPEGLVELMHQMSTQGKLYREARATHAAALASCEKLLVFREDIGRHNAVDMIVGHALRQRIPLEDKLLLTTGRASSEIVLKAARVGIPLVASRSAATALGVALAEEVGMTLVGSVRGGKLTVYCRPERLRRLTPQADPGG
jgi:FdhD protein